VILDRGKPLLRDKAKTAHGLRSMAIPPSLTALLKAQLRRVQESILLWGPEYAPRDPLLTFPDLAGRPCHPDKMTRRFRKIMKAAGIRGRQPCHSFRHASATWLLATGQDLKIVQTRLGHASAKMTLDVYGHALPENDRAAAERLDRLLNRQA
jgi:integrase